MTESVSVQQLQSVVFNFNFLSIKRQPRQSQVHGFSHNAFLQMHDCKRFPSFETLEGFKFEADAGSVDLQLQHNSVSLTAQTAWRSWPTHYVTITSFPNVTQHNLLKEISSLKRSACVVQQHLVHCARF